MITVLLQLAGLFALLSLLSVGGGNAVVPAMQHAAVVTYHWMSNRDFLDLYALSRVTPGPGSLVAALVGQVAAGVPGAIVAAVAMFAPSCTLAYCATRVWHRYRDAAWRDRAERGLAPVAIGLIFASVISLIQGSQHTLPAYVLTGVATLVMLLTRVNPMWLMGIGAVVGWFVHL